MTAATTVLSPTVGRDQKDKHQHKVGRCDLRGTDSSKVANKPRLSVMSWNQVETEETWSDRPLKWVRGLYRTTDLQQGNPTGTRIEY